MRLPETSTGSVLRAGHSLTCLSAATASRAAWSANRFGLRVAGKATPQRENPIPRGRDDQPVDGYILREILEPLRTAADLLVLFQNDDADALPVLRS